MFGWFMQRKMSISCRIDVYSIIKFSLYLQCFVCSSLWSLWPLSWEQTASCCWTCVCRDAPWRSCPDRSVYRCLTAPWGRAGLLKAWALPSISWQHGNQASRTREFWFWPWVQTRRSKFHQCPSHDSVWTCSFWRLILCILSHRFCPGKDDWVEEVRWKHLHWTGKSDGPRPNSSAL